MTAINSSNNRRRIRARLGAAAAALFACGVAYADAPKPALSDADAACVACHASEGMTKELANGDKLTLTVDGAAFARSVHAPIGCAACHADAALPAHPSNARTAKSARDYAIAQSQACRTCHDKTFHAYEASLHAVKLHEGNAAAPTCAGCHAPHAVSRASSADGPDRACMTCHGDPSERHAAWLPNASRHIDSIACSACHSPDALRMVDLRLYAGGKPLDEASASLDFGKRARSADRNRDGLDAGEFRALMADLGRAAPNVTVRGHMELRNPVDAHEIAAKPTALKACVDCHSEDATPFAKVTVSVLDADGRAVRYDAHKEVLRSAMNAEALRGFYAVGGTRIKLLDVLLALGLAGGIAVPALHLIVRRATRSRKEGSAS
jgi:hypothetical protein